MLEKLRFKDTIVITDLPDSLNYLGDLPKKLLCFDCLDNYSSFSWADSSVVSDQQELVKHSDIVTASALNLFDKLKRVNSSTFLLPNAVDFEHFSQANQERLFEENRPPAIGFVGAFYEWVDQELLLFLAESRPDWEFVIVGPRQPGLDNLLENTNNIFFLGAVNYRDLPRYISRFDVCIIPFKVNNTTISVNPIKMWEYMAAGKPVVSTPIPEALNFKDIILIGKTGEHFLSQIEKAFKNKDRKRILRGMQVARENDWNHRVEFLEQLIREFLAAKQAPPPEY